MSRDTTTRQRSQLMSNFEPIVRLVLCAMLALVIFQQGCSATCSSGTHALCVHPQPQCPRRLLAARSYSASAKLFDPAAMLDCRSSAYEAVPDNRLLR
jgi:hypothetical protein